MDTTTGSTVQDLAQQYETEMNTAVTELENTLHRIHTNFTADVEKLVKQKEDEELQSLEQEAKNA